MRIDGEAVAGRIAGVQGLGRGQRVVERVGPGAGRFIEGEAAVGADERGRKRRLEMPLAVVDVGNGQRAARAGVARRAVGNATGLNDRMCPKPPILDSKVIKSELTMDN